MKLINVGDLYAHTPIDSDTLELFGATDKERENFGVEDGDLFFTRSSIVPSGIAHCNIYRSQEHESVVFDSHVIRVRPDGRKIAPSYLFRVCLASVARRYLVSHAKTATMTTIDQAALGKCPVLLPPSTAEQEAIAEALSDTDAYIESLDQLLAKKRSLKQAAVQELLTGKTRLPGFSGEWRTKQLGELADIRSGGTPSTTQARFWDGDVLWCTPTDVTGLNGFKYLSDTSRRISRLGLKSSSAELVPANSVVMTSRATIGECAINQVPVSTNQGFKNFVPFEHLDVEFFYYLLVTQKQGFIALCGGSTFLEIGKAQLSAFEVRLPATQTEQASVATILSDLDVEIAALEANLAKARQLKQGMMQELLTGRIRLA